MFGILIDLNAVCEAYLESISHLFCGSGHVIPKHECLTGLFLQESDDDVRNVHRLL